MEIPTRRSNYTLLSQNPDEPLSGDKSKGSKSDRGGSFDWELIDHRMAATQSGRIGSIGLQRQSSGSSFGDNSSLSGEYYVPSSTADTLLDPDETFKIGGGGGVGEFRSKAVEGAGSVVLSTPTSTSTSKSWAQQTEESYQLQLALALRLSSEATCADDPNFLDPVPDESASRSPASAESISHRFWVRFVVLLLPFPRFSIRIIVINVWVVARCLLLSVNQHTGFKFRMHMQCIIVDRGCVRVELHNSYCCDQCHNNC